MTDGPLRALIFDSGLGGLSVFREIAARLPQLACVYAADTAFFPYGTKSEESLVRRLPRLLTAMAARYRPAIAVIACNTASTIALPPIRVALSLPVVGTVPAIKPAALMSRSRDADIVEDLAWHGCPLMIPAYEGARGSGEGGLS